MPEWVQVAAPVSIIVVLSALLVLFIWRCWCSRPQHQTPQQFLPSRPSDHHRALQDGIAKLHQTSLRNQLHRDSQRRPGYYVFRRGTNPSRPLFNWADHPSLVTDAVENGWSRFAFTGYMQSPSVRSSLLGLCAAGDIGRESESEFSWEVCQGSADFMQKIRLNPGGKWITPAANNNGIAVVSAAAVVKTALPLPGPPLGNSSFPQEAYFEITVLNFGNSDYLSIKAREGEKTKLIQESSSVTSNSESLVHTSSYSGPNKIEELKLNVREEARPEAVAVSVGLTSGGFLPLKLPGSYPGSIGFNSTGSVYLDGTKLVFESETAEWGRPDKVIGCGFDPKDRKVFFTVDSELMHVIHCKSEEFRAPLYPTLAANTDITVLVNFGQSAFRYAPANAHRTSNPCFIGPVVGSPAALGYEDSRELFSMGRIDAQWLNGFMNKGSQNHTNNNYNHHNNNNNNRVMDSDEESDADLFEIVLDRTGRSPGVVPASNSTNYT